MTLRSCARAVASAAVLLCSATAFADMPYLLPNTFEVGSRDYVTVQGGFTEEFFDAGTAMKANDYHALGPDGVKRPLAPVYTRDLTVVEVPTTAPGTYRISTGLRTGRTAKAAWVDGDWKFLGRNEAPPAGGKAYGRFSITPDRPGAYVAMTRYRPAPAANSTQGVSYTYSVVFEAT